MTSTSTSPVVTRHDDVTIIGLGPEYENLDEHLLDEVREAILAGTDLADPPLVVLDLSHTKFFGSAFIEILFRAWKRLNEREGGRFAISGLTPYCREVIEITHLDKLWDVYDTRDLAVSSITKTAA
ncbi:MAG: STAS domain-containing protein [Planctomycetota bacterium]|nr:STAS domain-containing protein [Planctomycetota bacterium]